MLHAGSHIHICIKGGGYVRVAFKFDCYGLPFSTDYLCSGLTSACNAVHCSKCFTCNDCVGPAEAI